MKYFYTVLNNLASDKETEAIWQGPSFLIYQNGAS